MYKNKFFIISSLLLSLVVLTSCNQDVDTSTKKLTSDISLNNSNKDYISTTAANLITEAIQQELDVDVVFYPTSNLNDDEVEFQINLENSGIDNRLVGITEEDLKDLYNQTDSKDKICTTYMSGSSIKDFIMERTLKNSNIDIHTNGIEYDINIQGGVVQNYNVLVNDETLDESKRYKVAFSYYEYDYKSSFPGYYYGNGFNYYSIIETDQKATDLLVSYLENITVFPNISEVNSKVTNFSDDLTDSIIPIYDIQGSRYQSEYIGINLSTRGIITAYVSDSSDNLYGFYMQDRYGDDSNITSDAIFVSMSSSEYSSFSSKIAVGNYVEVTGQVTETYTDTELTRTTLTNISKVTVREESVDLPSAIIIGEGSTRTIPSDRISYYSGNLNSALSIDVTDGVGFWESLEGMYVKIVNPIVVGTKGGKTDAYDSKSYFSMYVRAEDTSNSYQLTDKGGLIIDVDKNYYNPEIIRFVDHAFRNADGDQAGGNSYTNLIVNVGDELGDVEGICIYNVNLFGSGEYAVLPLTTVTPSSSRSSTTTLSAKPKTNLEGDADHLTVATFNVENMHGGHEKIPEIAEAIYSNMNAPDIVVFTEIQDNDGPDEYGSSTDSDPSLSAADETLTELIKEISDNSDYDDYVFINIDPEPYQDGGEPGGNIRVAAIYRSSRVSFEARGDAGATDHAGVDSTGSLKLNPGRVYPGTSIFEGTRKSLAMEFEFKGEKIIVIGNHLNSKGGDGSLWGADQPVALSTESKRVKLAEIVRGFTKEVFSKNSNANIIMLGDFNEFYASEPMKVLKGNDFTNLVETLPFNERYTYNFEGKSQAIDQLFISDALLNNSPEIEILNINSDYMGQCSDHDPVISRYKF